MSSHYTGRGYGSAVTVGLHPLRQHGYPRWIQGDETPRCKQCKQPMRLLLEIGNVEQGGLAWSDFLSAAYLFHCPDHFKERDFVVQST